MKSLIKNPFAWYLVILLMGFCIMCMIVTGCSKEEQKAPTCEWCTVYTDYFNANKELDSTKIVVPLFVACGAGLDTLRKYSDVWIALCNPTRLERQRVVFGKNN